MLSKSRDSIGLVIDGEDKEVWPFWRVLRIARELMIVAWSARDVRKGLDGDLQAMTDMVQFSTTPTSSSYYRPECRIPIVALWRGQRQKALSKS